MQASRKVRPFLEQAAAAAAAAADVQGGIKAQTAAKKAKKLTPEEMKKMRQEADPNYQAKQAAASTASPDGLPKKSKKGKAAASKLGLIAQAFGNASAASGGAKQADAEPKGEAAAAATHEAAQAAAQAQADHGAASGGKRRHGLGFAEEQPQSKRVKQATTETPTAGASSPSHPPQQAEAAAPMQQQGSAESAGDQQGKAAGGEPTRPAAAAGHKVGTHSSTDHLAASADQAATAGPTPAAADQVAAIVPKAAAQGPAAATKATAGQGKAADKKASGQAAGPVTGAVASSSGRGQQLSAGAPQAPPVIFTDECTAFVRGLDHKVTEADLRDFLAACGDIKAVRMVMDKITGRPKVGFAHDRSLCWQAAAVRNDADFDICPPTDASWTTLRAAATSNLRPADLLLSLLLAAYAASILQDLVGRLPNFAASQIVVCLQGFGYVEFGSNSALQKAVDLKDPELHGRKMTIMVSKPPSGDAGGRGTGIVAHPFHLVSKCAK